MEIMRAEVRVKTRNEVCMTPITEFPMAEVIRRIEELNSQLAKFWSQSHGWAPVGAAALLGKSRLDWQVSLSDSLRRWIREPPEALTPAELILAWVNLGSLIEGTIKLFLSVYYDTFKADIENLNKVSSFNRKKQKALSPDGLTLEPLRQYCNLREILDKDDLVLVELVQQRRNAIHAFRDRPTGDKAEFEEAVRSYLQMLRNVIARLPYPNDECVPSE